MAARPTGIGGDIRVLHVDDDPEFADLAAASLEREDDRFEVESATGAGKGLDRLAETGFDCVVSDYDMPGRNGIEFLEAVRERHPELPFILYTGKGSEAVAAEAVSAGVTDYLQKETGTSQYTVLANRIANAVEQRRSRRRVKESERRLSLFVEQSPLGVIEWNEAFEIEAANEVAEGILGYDEAELRGRSWESIVPESNRDSVEGVVSKLLAAEGGHHSINENLRADGDRIVCEWHNRVVTDDDGDTVAIFSQFQDITERREHRQQLEAVLDNHPGYIYRHRYDDGWPLEYVEGNPESVTGYTAAELEEILLAEEIIHPDDRADVWDAVETGLEASGKYDLTYRIVTKDDEVRWIRDIGRVVDDPVTDEPKLEGFVIDVSERERREVELQRERNRLQAIMEANPDIVIVYTAEGRYEDVLTGREQLLVSDVEQLLGATVEEALDADAADAIRDTIDATLETGRLQTVEYALEIDADRMWFEARAVPLPTASEPRVLFLVRDITDRVERKRELQRQNERLERFVDVVSHDLRGPLGVAASRIRLARDDCPGEHLTDATAALDRMETLIDDLLTVAREHDRETDREPVGLAELVERCWATVRTDDATLVVEDDRTIRADRSRLKQLFENLVHNAVEHGDDGVTVTVGTLPNGFYVADDGPGIPEGERESVFDAGYSTDPEGTGLGLSVVEEIAEAHGWRIEVTDSDGGGARFEMTGIDVVER